MRVLRLLLWLLSAIAPAMILEPRAARAQTDTTATAPLEVPTAEIAALPVALYTAQANIREASDSAVIGLANDALSQRLHDLLGSQAVARARVMDVATSSEARERGGGQACGVVVACARYVGATVHAPWVVMAKVSKTSNLIWLLTGQLIQVATGKIVLDDSTELKGDPRVMVRAGVRIFAERVARTVRHRGVTTNFPAP